MIQGIVTKENLCQSGPGLSEKFLGNFVCIRSLVWGPKGLVRSEEHGEGRTGDKPILHQQWPSLLSEG